MNKEELRIGNYVMYDNKVVFIAEILKEGVRIYDGWGFDKTTPYECIRPIVIDEISLNKSELKSYELGYYELFEEYGKCLNINIDGYVYLNGIHLTELNYIHEIQNLYYSINKENLKFDYTDRV